MTIEFVVKVQLGELDRHRIARDPGTVAVSAVLPERLLALRPGPLPAIGWV